MKIYFVKKGDTLFEIAQKHGVTVEEILAANKMITDPNQIDAGMKILIPAKQASTIKPSASDLAAQFQTTQASISASETDMDGSSVPPHLPPTPEFPPSANAGIPQTSATPPSAGVPQTPVFPPVQSYPTNVQNVPNMNVPNMNVPNMNVPNMNVPNMNVPNMNMPSMPNMNMPFEPSAHPFAQAQIPAYPVQAPIGAPQWPMGMNQAGGQEWPFPPYAPFDQSGYEAPYNTPFGLNNYMVPTPPHNQPIIPYPGRTEWAPYRLDTIQTVPAFSPHALVMGDITAEDYAGEESGQHGAAHDDSGRDSVRSRKGKKQAKTSQSILREQIIQMNKKRRGKNRPANKTGKSRPLTFD